MKNVKMDLKFTEGKDETYWSEQIELQIRSQLSGTEYCKKKGLSYGQFAYWSKKLRKKIEVSLIPVQIEVEGQNSYHDSSHETSKKKVLCTLSLKCGNELCVHDEKALLLILKELG